MNVLGFIRVVPFLLVPGLAVADPTMECGISNGTQVEIGDCLAKVEADVDQTVTTALGFAMTSAASLDDATGRKDATTALTVAQEAWTAYRDAQCNSVGATYGGGSGTGIAIRSCRIDLGRDRVQALMAMVN